MAKFVWDVLDQYGFGSVEKLISWLNRQENKDALAKIVLNDDYLRRQLNYNASAEQSLDYVAVAKAGVLLFADHVHNQYVEKIAWVKNTWDWLMGVLGKPNTYTLTDVVAEIWALGESTVNAVKNAANQALRAVKAAGKYILNNVIAPILNKFQEMLYNLLKGLFIITAHLTPLEFREEDHVLVLSTGNGGLELRFKVEVFLEQLAVGIIINDILVLKTYSPFLFPQTNIETLGNAWLGITDDPEKDAEAYAAVIASMQGLMAIVATMIGTKASNDDFSTSVIWVLALMSTLPFVKQAFDYWNEVKKSKNPTNAQTFAALLALYFQYFYSIHLAAYSMNKVKDLFSHKSKDLSSLSFFDVIDKKKALIFTCTWGINYFWSKRFENLETSRSIREILPLLYVGAIITGLLTKNIFDTFLALSKYSDIQVGINIIMFYIFAMLSLI